MWLTLNPPDCASRETLVQAASRSKRDISLLLVVTTHGRHSRPGPWAATRSSQMLSRTRAYSIRCRSRGTSPASEDRFGLPFAAFPRADSHTTPDPSRETGAVRV